METPLSYKVLSQQTAAFRNTAGISRENRASGFRPAFYDTQQDRTELARFSDGTPAPCHLLDGVPKDWVTQRDRTGRVTAVKPSIVAGFIRNGRFYTREEAARSNLTLAGTAASKLQACKQ